MTATRDAISERFDQSQHQFRRVFGHFCTDVSVIRALDNNASAEPEDSSITIARAPLRVSLGGGGTDLPSFADRHGGLVISLAITRYVSVTIFPRSFDGSVRMTGEETEECATAKGMQNRFARAALLRGGRNDNIQVAACTDAPSGTGLGGSGAFIVSMLHALREHENPLPVELAEEASAVERVDLGRPVGKHDHYMAAYGGLRVLRIARDGAVTPESIEPRPALTEYIRDRLMLFYTGISRDAGQVLAAQDQMTRHGNDRTISSLWAIRRVADQVLDAVRHGRVDDIGPLMDEHWQAKLRLSHKVSNPYIDALYKTAQAAGSDGGRLLGAGGGGFLLISAGPGRAADVRAAMSAEGMRELPFELAATGSIATILPL
jgi:D-glycero-alpha-D-manno-heptose-7-phosphate kinase